MSLDMPIMEVRSHAIINITVCHEPCFSRQVYGMSESSGPHSINHILKGFHACSAGKTVPGCITKIADPDKDGNGEVFTEKQSMPLLFGE